MVDHEFFNRIHKREQEIERNGGEFTDEMARNMIEKNNAVAGMQIQIIERVNRMAEELAVAGVASQLVKGDSAHYAVDRWCDILREEAHRLLREKESDAQKTPQILAGQPPRLAGS